MHNQMTMVTENGDHFCRVLAKTQSYQLHVVDFDAKQIDKMQQTLHLLQLLLYFSIFPPVTTFVVNSTRLVFSSARLLM